MTENMLEFSLDYSFHIDGEGRQGTVMDNKPLGENPMISRTTSSDIGLKSIYEELDGYETTEQFKEDEALRAIIRAMPEEEKAKYLPYHLEYAKEQLRRKDIEASSFDNCFPEARNEFVNGFNRQRRINIIREEIVSIFGKHFNDLPATKRKKITTVVQNIVEALDSME